MKKYFILTVFALIVFPSVSQEKVPATYSNMFYDAVGTLKLNTGSKTIPSTEKKSLYTLKNLKGNPSGHAKGILFDFGIPDFSGTMYFGLIHHSDSKHPLPVYFKRKVAIENGKCLLNIKDNLTGKYDMTGWEDSGKGSLGYRVVGQNGTLLYDGKVNFKGVGPFEVDITIIEGPFINLLTDRSAVISFQTNEAVVAHIDIAETRYSDKRKTRVHEILVDELQENKEYEYTLVFGENTQSFSFKTAPTAGSRKPFTFAYASDSRNAQGGGERNLYGTNYYIIKKICALAYMKNARFMQFTGDLIDGYLIDKNEMHLQYANWKRAVEPFAHYFPVIAGMGNHEALMRIFEDDVQGFRYMIDRFPYETESAEVVFAQNFVNPLNGPESEDGAYYDPNKSQTDFPSYKENVFYYTYDNVAVIVLNSDYWYAPSLEGSAHTSGNLHGYIMDNQLAWLEESLKKLEKDSDIDHIFVTQHTPAFPNGGHVDDDMWYNGNNLPRPFIAGNAVEKGIIERRDEYLDLLINKSDKVVAILTGDEHNYNKLEISSEMEIYPENWDGKRLELKRTIYQINNGAAGAPYYAREETPWTPHVSGFTTQNALVLFHVNGREIKVEVINPDTLELIEEYKLR